MPEVTIVIVYQNSQPWLSTCCAALDHFKVSTPVRYVFIENQPSHDNGVEVVKKFLEGKDGINIATKGPPVTDGRAHSHGLDIGFSRVTTEWTMFLDADTVVLRDGWLDEMLAIGCDMVGAECDSGLNDYSLPILHPCFLLFRTALAKPPYWDMFFGSWGHGQILPYSAAGGTWDVCRPFTYTIGMRQDLKQHRLQNNYCREDLGGFQVYFTIGESSNPIAFHAREGSQAIARHRHDDRWKLITNSGLFTWYKGEVVKPYDCFKEVSK